MADFDAIVIGAGTVGAAIGYGLGLRKWRVLVLDGADTDFRAARANFGLVWSQGKGRGMPAYQMLTKRSSDMWPEFHRELRDTTGGMAIDYQHSGGIAFCMGDEGLEERQTLIAALHAEHIAFCPDIGEPDVEMLTRDEVQGLMPELRLGNRVSGASFGKRDGHVNPLQLLSALHKAIRIQGGEIRGNTVVEDIRPGTGGYEVRSGRARWRAERVIIAAGIASGDLGRLVGLNVPVRAQRGQVLVTQRLAPLLPLPCSGLRQTAEGTIMIGATKEEVGADVSATTRASAWLSRKTVEIAPDLARAQLVRHWSGLRIMTPDGHPVYAQSEEHPGIFVASCHSGVTLAAVHASELAGHIAAGALPANYETFHHRRFDVQTTH
ncbi:Glycine/D-amino acid oxidase [Nitratireductor aquibiodomus]|uniref:Glycine/D-amino acid oxidase n=1 Tax=Nitratireductor aquibiodomus TaxID=204799 RepID=A0A1H4JE48_9HYPH|nr:FAD-dependent oxidoreductase [Nitratireductor aquibiodomus]SEB43898.1 Glycine/D-amino acid oxidase [Nitratireductor aquibiodomus]